MKPKEPIKDWEKGLEILCKFQGIKKDQFEQVEIFINELLSQERLRAYEEGYEKGRENKAPMGVSQWKNHGIKYNYWDYFSKQERLKVKEDIYKELEELDKQANEGARKEKEELIKAGYATEGGKFDLEEFAKSIEQRIKEQVKKEIKKWLIEELEGIDTNGKCHEEIIQDFEDLTVCNEKINGSKASYGICNCPCDCQLHKKG